MDVSMVPFGNAQFQAGKVVCQHGVDECTLNSWEQCSIANYPSFADYWPFYLCIEQSALACGDEPAPGPCALKAVKGCADKAKLDYSKLSACVHAPAEALELQHKFAELTPSNHQYTPWVLIDKKLSSQSETLIQQVCTAYKGALPSGCKPATQTRTPGPISNSTETCPASW